MSSLGALSVKSATQWRPGLSQLRRSYLKIRSFSLIAQGAFVVTRLKSRIKCRVAERREVDERQGITFDQTIGFTSLQSRKRRPLDDLLRNKTRGPPTCPPQAEMKFAWR